MTVTERRKFRESGEVVAEFTNATSYDTDYNSTIVKVDNKLWRIDWAYNRVSKTAVYPDDPYPDDPYRVAEYITTTYEPIN